MARLNKKVQKDCETSTTGVIKSRASLETGQQVTKANVSASTSLISEPESPTTGLNSTHAAIEFEQKKPGLQLDMPRLNLEPSSLAGIRSSVSSKQVRRRSMSSGGDSLLENLAGLKIEETEKEQEGLRRSPRKFAGKSRQQVKQLFFQIAEDGESDEESETGEEEDSDLSDFIVNDSASEAELKRPSNIKATRSTRTTQTRVIKPTIEKTPRRLVRRLPDKKPSIVQEDTDDEVRVVQSTGKMTDDPDEQATGSNSEENDKENRDHRSRTSGKADDNNIFKLGEQLTDALRLAPPVQDFEPEGETLAATPPQSPSRARLNSPTRNKTIIPRSPHRQSVDAFWSQNDINDWNDEHSPKKKARAKNALLPIFLSPKKLGSPKKLNFESDAEDSESDDGYLTPTEKGLRKERTPLSPAKKHVEDVIKNPYVTSNASFFKKTGRYMLAQDFLAELVDRVSVASIGDGSASRIDDLTHERSGVEIVWSKTLQTTAGRASVKRKAGQDRKAPKLAVMKIELAEKVVDRPEYLLNTLAHEFAHLCNMAEDIKAPAHGAGFKKWARCIESSIKTQLLSPAIRELKVDIHITTKHTYSIDYKYVWACMECGRQVGRHSKSLPDHALHTTDGGKMMLIKPKPRNLAKLADGTPSQNAWDAFRKENFALVKAELSKGKTEKVKLGEVMAVLSERWRQNKTDGHSPSADVDAVGLDRKADSELAVDIVDISDEDLISDD